MNKGFTLIELLVVVLIIGILSAVALPQYEKSVEKSRAAEAATLVRAIADAETLYHLANGTYAKDISKLDFDFPGEKVIYQSNNIPGFQTKNFVCRPAGGAWTDAIAVCNRLPFQTNYAIVKLENGKMVCRFYSTKGESICKTMGTKSGSDYIFN